MDGLRVTIPISVGVGLRRWGGIGDIDLGIGELVFIRSTGVFDLDIWDEFRLGMVGVPDLDSGEDDRLKYSRSSMSTRLGAFAVWKDRVSEFKLVKLWLRQEVVI